MFRVSMGLVVIACGCASGAASGLPDAAPGELVPPPPAAITDRAGVYTWGFDDSSWPHSPDRLAWSASRVATLGTHVLRIALSTTDPYQVNGGATSLREIASRPAYAALWGDPQWSTIIITAYSAADNATSWSDGFTADEVAAEQTQIADLGTFLLGFAGKQFIIMPWEGDNALAAFVGNDVAWAGYIDWINSRAAGVVDARAAVTSTTSHLYSGLEFNAVRLANGNACGVDDDRCVISYVGPRVTVDYYSYSSWQSLAADVPDAAVHDQLVADLGAAVAYVRPARPAITATSFLVGELGAARDAPDVDECSAAARTLAAIQGAVDAGASYAIAWQVIDNAPSADLYTGFGAYKYDGGESMTGLGVRHLWANVVPALPVTTCPTINAGGVVNGTTYTSDIHTGDTLTIFGKDFAASGNIVHLKEGAMLTTVTAGSTYWYEAPGQINFTLPAGIAAGSARVYVTNSSQLDSNGQVVTVQ